MLAPTSAKSLLDMCLLQAESAAHAVSHLHVGTCHAQCAPDASEILLLLIILLSMFRQVYHTGALCVVSTLLQVAGGVSAGWMTSPQQE